MDAKAVAQSFYEAFVIKDGNKMASLYSDEVEFSDPVFPCLKGEDAKSMWRMLCAKGADLKIEFMVVAADGPIVEVRWDALYTFVGTGRQVHNKVLATITIENGKIVRHIDRFNFWRWSSQALGLPGLILGWTPMLRKKVQHRAKKSLDHWCHQLELAN